MMKKSNVKLEVRRINYLTIYNPEANIAFTTNIERNRMCEHIPKEIDDVISWAEENLSYLTHKDTGVSDLKVDWQILELSALPNDCLIY